MTKSDFGSAIAGMCVEYLPVFVRTVREVAGENFVAGSEREIEESFLGLSLNLIDRNAFNAFGPADRGEVTDAALAALALDYGMPRDYPINPIIESLQQAQLRWGSYQEVFTPEGVGSLMWEFGQHISKVAEGHRSSFNFMTYIEEGLKHSKGLSYAFLQGVAEMRGVAPSPQSSKSPAAASSQGCAVIVAAATSLMTMIVLYAVA